LRKNVEITTKIDAEIEIRAKNKIRKI